MKNIDLETDLRVALDDLVWDARLCRYSGTMVRRRFIQLADLYLDRVSREDLSEIQEILESFKAQLTQGLMPRSEGISI